MTYIMLFPSLNVLYLYIITFRSMCAVPIVNLFYSSLMPYFPGMLLSYFQNDFEVVPFVPVITGVTFFTFHMRSISVVNAKIFLDLLLLLLLLC
jgi:hypothetical protein